MKKRDSREGGEGVPTDLRGKLTESQLRKSKNLAKRRRQKNRTKSRSKKGSEMWQNPAKATFDTKKLYESDISPKCCESDKDGSKSAKIPLNMAEACGELRRAPARPGGKTKGPQPGQLHAPWPTTGGGETTGARSDYTALGRGSAARSKAARPCWVITAMSRSARASTAERSGSFAPFSNLNFFVKNRQNFFAIELMNIH